MSAQKRSTQKRSTQKKVKIILTKIGLDGHDVGSRFVATVLRDAGMEVVYLGKFQFPEMIVAAALQEGADAIGISCLSQTHVLFIPEVIRLLKEKKMSNVQVFAGGTIPEPFKSELIQAGTKAVFGPQTPSSVIVEAINSAVKGN